MTRLATSIKSYENPNEAFVMLALPIRETASLGGVDNQYPEKQEIMQKLLKVYQLPQKDFVYFEFKNALQYYISGFNVEIPKNGVTHIWGTPQKKDRFDFLSDFIFTKNSNIPLSIWYEGQKYDYSSKSEVQNPPEIRVIFESQSNYTICIDFADNKCQKIVRARIYEREGKGYKLFDHELLEFGPSLNQQIASKWSVFAKLFVQKRNFRRTSSTLKPIKPHQRFDENYFKL